MLQPQDFTRYEQARILGARALQIAMNAPLLIKIKQDDLESIKFDALKMDSTQQMSIRGVKLRQKICEIIGNEGARIGGKKKMRPLHVGASLSMQIIKEFIFWEQK